MTIMDHQKGIASSGLPEPATLPADVQHMVMVEWPVQCRVGRADGQQIMSPSEILVGRSVIVTARHCRSTGDFVATVV